MDAARLWQLVALLARLNPDSALHWQYGTQFREYGKLKALAEGSVSAGLLKCLTYYQRPDQNQVLMSEFLKWAQSKRLSIPPELAPPERTGPASTGTAASSGPASTGTTASSGPASTGAVASSQIKGIKEFMRFCEVRGLVFGSERAARAFIEKSEIKPIDGHAKKGRRVYDAAAIEPKVLAESERRKNWPR